MSSKTVEERINEHRAAKNSINAASNSVSERIAKHRFERSVKVDSIDSDIANLKQDINSFYSNWQSQDDVKKYRDSIVSMQNRLTDFDSYLSYNTSNESNTIRNNIKTISENLSNLINQVDERSKLYAKYKNADEWNNAVNNATYQNKYKGITTYQQANDLLNSQDYKSQRESGKISDEESEWLQSYGYSLATESDLQSEISSLEKETNSWNHTKSIYQQKKQEYNNLIANARSYMGRENEYKQKLAALQNEISDFEKEITVIDSKNAKLSALKTTLAKKQQKAEFDKKWGEAIGKTADYQSTFTNGYHGASEINLFDRNADWEYEAVNHADVANTMYRPGASNASKNNYNFYKLMKDDERGTYNWIYHNKGKEAASEYLKDLINLELDSRMNAEFQKNAYDFASQNGWAAAGASALSVIPSLASGLEYAGNMLSGNPNQRSTLASVTTGLREGTKSNWDESKNEEVWDFLYDTGMSGVDSLAAAGINVALPYAGEALLGASAAANKANELLDSGVSGAQVVLGSVTSGVLEALFEHVSIERLGSLATKKVPEILKEFGLSKKALAKMGENISKSVFTNASEEFFTEVGNIVADSLIQGDLSQYAQQVEEYYASGKSIEEAKKLADSNMHKQVGLAAAGGGLMGFAFGTIGAATGTVSTYKNAKSVGNVILKSPSGIENLKSSVAKFGTDSAVYKALSVLDSDSSAADVGLAYFNAMQKATEQSRSQLIEALKQNGAPEKGRYSSSYFADRIMQLCLPVEKTKDQETQMLLLSTNQIAGPVVSAYAFDGKYGFDEIRTLQKAFINAEKESKAQNDPENATMNQNPVDNAEDKLNVTEMLSDETLQNVVAYQQENGNNVPLHVLGTNKGSTLYKALKSAGMINADGTVNAEALVNEYNRRSGDQNANDNPTTESLKKDDHDTTFKGDTAIKEEADKSIKKKLDVYTETQYNNFGWVRYNDVLESAEYQTLLSRYADFKHNKDKYPVTKWGEAVISSTECPDVIMYVKGSISNPQITKIIRIVSDDSADISVIRERILKNENEQMPLPYKTITEYFGPEFLEFHRKRDYASFRTVLAREEGADRESGDFDRGTEQERNKHVHQYKGNDQADSVEGSAFDLDKNADDKNNSNSDDVNADADVQSDNYAKDDKYWKAENKNQDDSVPKGLLQKIKELFSKNSGESNTSLGEIVKLIEKTFNIPISTGKFHQKAYGIYKNKSKAIRTKVSNALPTIAHEVGHHLDKKYGLRSLPSIGEAIQVLKDTRPDFFNSYPVKQRPAEAVAEFIRDYLADRTLAKNKYPKFYQEFESKLNATSNKDSKIDGANDLQNLKTIGDLINKYYTAEKVDRARAAVVSRAEAKRRNRNFADLKTKLKTHLYDDGAVLKEVSDEAHDLFDYAKKGVVRSHNTLVGDYMAGFDGDLVQQLDKDGNPVKDENGDPVYVPALTKLFDDIRTKDELVDFKMYLIYKHGLEFLSNNKRVFADDTINNKEFMSEQIAAMEKKYPQFKDIAESVYEWQRTFMYEYGVKSGLMSEQTAKALWQKYPCYIPFNRNVEGAIKSFGKRGLANQNAAIRSAKGSGLDMCDPIENIALKVEEFMKAADRNAVMQEIANTADQEGGFGYMLEQVPPDMSPTTVSAEKTKQTIDQLLKENLSQTDATTIYEALNNAIGDVITDFQISSKQGGNVVWVYRNGKKTYYQVHDSNLLQALIGLNRKQFDIITTCAGKVTRLFKAFTTGANAVWSLTSNSVRDFSSAYKYSVEKNPIKFTVDYVKAIGNVMSQIGDSKGKRTSEYLKLYRTLGGGYNSSVVNTQQLKSTVKSIVSLDKTMPQKVAHSFNILHRIETLADAVETAPRLAEFKRVLEKTGDKRQALKAAEEITVNFNRSGTTGKWIDQWIPYFNASIQGTTKFIDNLLHNQVFRTKTIVSGILKVALLFAWNMIAMGDDDNDEYEKLSAYKKNNFYNIYKGNGEFISIPKAKDVAYFDSIVERIFEMAFKEDVDWAQEVQDFAAYTWLVFGPPLADDVIIGSTLVDLVSNEDFKGTPIVPSAYDDLLPEYQYNENTTWIAYGIGQMFGLSPMQIDHIIDSNFGWLGLLNRSLGKMSGEKDWSLGVGTKTVTDNTYSTDIINHFYDHAETANKTANSRPDDGDAVAKNKQYAAAKSVISALNAYGKDDADSVRDYRILARDYADNFEKNTVGNTDKRLIQLYERCNNADIFADKTFNREYSIDKVKYTMDSDLYLDYVDEYYAKINELYDDILDLGASDEMTVIMLVQAKQEVTDLLNEKYKTGDEEPKDFSSNWKNSVVNEMGDNIQRKSKSGEITYSEQREYNRYLKSLK